jgi:hypothetical protein
MSAIVFFLEEPSAREMLKGLLPKILPADIAVQYVVFEGKQDLEKRLPMRLRAWLQPDVKFIVLRDKDGGDGPKIKSNLVETCKAAGKPFALVRIACHELETFYLGDLSAVSKAFDLNRIRGYQGKVKYRDPDRLANPAEELKKLVPEYQKVSGSRAIGSFLDVEKNMSRSFVTLITGIRKIIGEAV